jgi:4-oxalocrotonate tautomerase
MPHIDMTMIPGRDDKAKAEIAVQLQRFAAEKLKIDPKFVSVSIEDIPRESWEAHMQSMSGKTMYVKPGV